jgi:lipopolysaccharide export system permease protein
MTLAEKVGLSFSHFTLFTKIILLRLPAYVGLALPMASLLASLLAFGRMGSDCEIIALRMGGISTLRLLRPAIFLFLAVTIFHLLLAEVGSFPRKLNLCNVDSVIY